ncbi:MAG: flagellar hook-associated protein FlgK [Fimbriimonadaceae bacterium]|nr:flagellar hook-associated protein FlgK [Fimbriimonadaceae bacterium]
MPGSFHGIGIANSALRNIQRALDVTGHNIANVNNRNYTRQTVDFGTEDPTTFFARGLQSLGSGVTITSVNRIRDLFLDGRRAGASADFGRMNSLAAGLQQLEGVLNEPGNNGVSAALNRFFDAFSGLSSNPSDPAARVEAQQAAKLLAQRVRGAAGDSSSVDAQLVSQTNAYAARVNDLSATIASLNDQIAEKTAAGASPNDLLDLRDSAFEELSGLVNAEAVRTETGGMRVFIGGFALVDEGGAHGIPTAFDAATGTFGSGANQVRVTGGRIGGTLEALQGVRRYRADLDAVADAIRDQVNTLHRTGVAPDGSTGLDLFSGTSAADFNLASEVAADPNRIAAGTSGVAGDGDLARAIAGLRDLPLPGLGGRTIEAFYTSVATRIGAETASAGDELETRRAVLDQIDAQKQSISGVSLDEEMANMLQLQRSYQAAARTLSQFDRMTEDLLGLLR